MERLEDRGRRKKKKKNRGNNREKVRRTGAL